MIPESFNEGWFVRRQGATGFGGPVGPITVPHDAMLAEPRDPGTANSHHTGFFPGGVYRYSKSFRAPDAWRDCRVTLEFEGVYMRSEVHLNGHLVGGRPSGYAMFHVDLDEHLDHGADNLFEVVVRNDASPNSRWYTGSGIYRPVHLLVGGRVRVPPEGLRVTTTSVVGSDALVEVATTVVNDGEQGRSVTITVRFTGPAGELVGSVDEDLAVEPHATATLRQTVPVPHAALWSPEHPHLHTAEVALTVDGVVVDRAQTEFGIRTLAVDPTHGLRINGQTVKLRGACIHHDNGVIGAHTLDAAEDRRIRILKESGYNAIRSAHNPVARATLRACDRHGVLVMDELTDAWWRPKVAFDVSQEFEEWWERDLEAMIAKDANHPSVVLYSIGNEIGETATERGVELNRRLADRTRELDPTRLVTNCINGFLNLIGPTDDEKLAKKNAANRESGEAPNKNLIVILNALMGVLEKTLKYLVRLPAVDRRTRDAYAAVDVAGYNYMVGRYRHEARHHPDRVIVGSETNPAETVAIWQQIEDLPQVIGDFTWTGWDYIGEAGCAVIRYDERRQLYAPWPGLLAGTPVIDITGRRQTQSYLNEIAWHLGRGPHLAVQPVNHAGQKRTARVGRTDSIRSWSWEGCEGRVATVEVYADAARVDLLLDGSRVGRAPAGPATGYLALFSLPYRPGRLTAVAYGSDGQEIGRDTLSSATTGLRLEVRSESDALVADGADLAYLPIAITDDAGVVRPLADREVTVQVTGAGTLLGLGSAEPITEEGFSSNRHTTYLGRALAVVRAGHHAGDVTVTVSAPDCDTVTVVLLVKSVTAEGSDQS